MMTDPSEPLTAGTSPHHSRSGDDVTEAVEVAESGTSVQDVHDKPERNKSGEAPVEQTAGDPAMTEGQVVQGESGGGSGQGPESASSGAAQSQRGARASDLAAAGED
jgi:hypothetical protein